jgi:hypothetical protein
MSRFSFEDHAYLHAESASAWSSYDFITGINFNLHQVVEVTGSRFREPSAQLPPWAFVNDHGGWSSFGSEGGGGPSTISVPKPIELGPHVENVVKAIISRDPIAILETGVSIFSEMVANSRHGMVNLSQIAMP